MTEEMSSALEEMYLTDLNQHVLPYVDFDKLAESYKTQGMAYAKQVLAAMHTAFVKRYGSEYATEQNCGDFVTVPAVIRAIETGEICIGVVSLDLSAACEHWGTDFFTEHGVLKQGHESDHELRARIRSLAPYNYWYTVKTLRDIHLDNRHYTAEIDSMIKYARNAPQQEKTIKSKQQER